MRGDHCICIVYRNLHLAYSLSYRFPLRQNGQTHTYIIMDPPPPIVGRLFKHAYNTIDLSHIANNVLFAYQYKDGYQSARRRVAIHSYEKISPCLKFKIVPLWSSLWYISIVIYSYL